MTATNFNEESYYQETFTKLELGNETVKSVVFEECVFDASSFIGTQFNVCRFTACKFHDCTLSAIIALNTRFDGATFTNCKAIGIDWTKAQAFRDIVFKNCQLNYSNFRFMKMPKLKMTDCEAKDVDFSEADLTNGDLKNTDFEKSRFFKTNLTGADLRNAKNYAINPNAVTLKKTRFSYPEVTALLNGLDIIID